MSTELTALPQSFPAGTTVTYRKSFSDYPASEGWTLTLHLAGVSRREIEAEAEGDEFVVTIPATQTGDSFTAGFYRWAERVSKDEEVYQVAAGGVDITPDLTRSAEASQQEWLEAQVAALKDHIARRLPAGMETYQVAGRAVSKIPIKEAFHLLTVFEGRLWRLKNPGRIGRPVYVRFTPPETETES